MTHLMSKLTVRIEVVGVRKFALRRRLAFPLFKLAAWILGCSITIDWGISTGE